MSHAIFYLLEQASGDTAASHFDAACHVAAECYSNKQKCLVWCDNQQDAEQIDELLWQLPTERFVPHNLLGDGPKGGAAVEITWETPARSNRTVLINLASEAPSFSRQFRQVFDFVPAEENLKQQARNRYKSYRGAGISLDTKPFNQVNAPQG
ncbi:DNA polymerase III subunit chi [Alteromonadaceae bacterium M269]|nr:DNA polymerase III subunit chi [Alteromonadaceae bacterium M269]